MYKNKNVSKANVFWELNLFYFLGEINNTQKKINKCDFFFTGVGFWGPSKNLFI